MVGGPEYTLRVNMAMTMDGRVTLPDGTWRGVCSAEDRRRMDLFRSQAELLIMGSGSIEKDDPLPDFRTPGFENSFPEGSEVRPPRPVIICRNHLPAPDRRVFDSLSRPIMLISERLKRDAARHASRADVEILSDDELRPVKIVEKLVTSGYRRILLEGGPRLNFPFFEAGLVNILNITLVPYLFGQRGLPAVVEGEVALPHFNKQQWRLNSAEKVADELFMEYHLSGLK